MRFVLLLFLLATALLGTGCVRVSQAPQETQRVDPSEAQQVPKEDLILSGRPAPVVRHTPIAGDWKIVIPSIKVEAPIVAVGLEPDGSMGAPDTPEVVGWYKHGAAPGERGNVLMDGHVDWTNRQTGVPFTGVFWDLNTLDPGDQLKITDGSREFVYEVIDKKRFKATDPEGVSVLQPTQEPRITLITCGGNFNRATHTYDTREIIIGRLVT